LSWASECDAGPRAADSTVSYAERRAAELDGLDLHTYHVLNCVMLTIILLQWLFTVISLYQIVYFILKCFLLYVTVLTLNTIVCIDILIFVTFSFMKVTSKKNIYIFYSETEPYVLMFCSHWIGNDLVFSSNPRKGKNRHCWVCPVPWDSRTVVALSVLTIASYLHTGKLLRYFLRWLVLMLGFFINQN